jgi:HSP20 family protein
LVPTSFEPDLSRCRVVGRPAEPALARCVCRIVLQQPAPGIHRESELVERRAVACLMSVGPHRDHPVSALGCFVPGICSVPFDSSQPIATRCLQCHSDLSRGTGPRFDEGVEGDGVGSCLPARERSWREEDSMTLVKRMQHELDRPTWMSRRFFDMPDFFGDLFEESSMKIEEFETDGHLVIRAEMPGIDPDEDVEITVTDGMLHLKAERTEETKTEDTKGYRSEFRYGSFSRSMRLPAGATEDDVVANYEDGILEVRIPVSSEQATAKKIPVNRGK